jgi:RHS repeat-associated protein
VQGDQVEWTLGGAAAINNQFIIVGLSYTNPDNGYTSVKYGWYTNNAGLTILESGALPAGQTYGYFGAYAPGDVLKIVRDNGLILYYHNGNLKYSRVDTQPTSTMLVDFAFNEYNRSIYGLKIVKNSTTAIYTADVVSYSDYSPYGTLLDSRHGNDNTYRYGFQGQERDDEIKGAGNSYNYEYRMHDPRIGRFFAVDPLAPKYPYLTPYQFASNSPIYMLEVEGLEGKIFHYSVWWDRHGDRQSELKWTGLNDGDRGGLLNASPHVAYMGTRIVEYNQRAIHYWNSKGKNYKTDYKTIKDGPSGTVNIQTHYFLEILGFNRDANNGLVEDYENYVSFAQGPKVTMPYKAYEKFSAPFLKHLAATIPPPSNTGAATPCDGLWQSLVLGGFGVGGVGRAALTETTAERGLVNMSEEIVHQAIFYGEEKVGDYSIEGIKGLVGTTYNRNIFYVGTKNKSLANFRSFVKTLEQEAIDAGANKISIYGSTIRNDGFLNPFVVKRFGYTIENSGSGAFLQKTLK